MHWQDSSNHSPLTPFFPLCPQLKFSNSEEPEKIQTQNFIALVVITLVVGMAICTNCWLCRPPPVPQLLTSTSLLSQKKNLPSGQILLPPSLSVASMSHEYRTRKGD
ncbi:hypothetical protein D5086_014817 [Populus alba]|uniref:Uncharacterized protein n=1 Tax=Populus alba TaxID=43335 RepID=A0ACC4BZU2_POPAL